MRHRFPEPGGLFHGLSITAILLVLVGCAVKFVSSYDEQTDRAVTELQKKVESFFVRLERLDGLPECSYEHHKGFYEDAEVQVSSIQLRASAIPQNSITVEQMELVERSVESLEELHKLKAEKDAGDRCITQAEIQPLRENFNTIFTAILTFELAKKRGGEF
jgi:hypothetical protein